MSCSRPRRAIARAQRAWLRVVHPRGLDAVMTLGNEDTVVGRDLVNDRTVSRRHVVIDHDGRQHRLRDLGSHNGTRVDGTVTATWEPLAAGSIVRIGDVLLVYEIGERPPEYRGGAFPGYAVATELLRERIELAAMDPAPVLLVGETGTGKEWIARELHRASGRAGSLVSVNCATLSEQLVESQLFGHVRGSFTGAKTDQDGFFRAAQGGTLFLDEIGELPLELQPKLLRVLQEREVQPLGSTRTVPVDVRVIAATNRDLAECVETSTFRRDLYARLALWEVRVPALRERRADILDWVDRLHRIWSSTRGASTALDLDTDAAEALLLAPHRENLRGLDRLVHELRGGEITRADLPAWITRGAQPEPSPVTSAALPTREEFVAEYERLSGSVRALARRFGRDRRQIYRWVQAYELRKP